MVAFDVAPDGDDVLRESFAMALIKEEVTPPTARMVAVLDRDDAEINKGLADLTTLMSAREDGEGLDCDVLDDIDARDSMDIVVAAALLQAVVLARTRVDDDAWACWRTMEETIRDTIL